MSSKPSKTWNKFFLKIVLGLKAWKQIIVHGRKYPFEGAHERKHPFIDVRSDQSVQRYSFGKMDDKQHPRSAGKCTSMMIDDW